MHGFKSSINLQFDLTNQELVNRYLLSTSHAEVLRGILESVSNTSGMHAHLLVGPYGTGKSLISAIVCQILSKLFQKEWMDKLLKQADRYDQLLADRLRQVPNTMSMYIPVIINGRSGSFRTIINHAVHRALQQAGVTVSTPNEIHTILATVERWKQSYPIAYEAFLTYVQSLDYTESAWIDQIGNYNENLIQQFAEFYPSVTSGTKWSIEHNEHFVENVERLLGELRNRGLGLVIVYDEFGRFLQSLHTQEAISNMQDLQDLAELANNSNNFQLLVVGHKHIRQYATQSKEYIRTEFEKVEKRFRSYNLETDSATYLRLAQEAGAGINMHSLPQALKLEDVQTLQSNKLFVEFTPYQLENYIIRGLYPLHPVAVVLLPYLSNVFGQNERTLFSFYGDDERYGLRDHITQENGYYCADKLFHYFQVHDAEQSEHAALLLYHKIAPYIAQQAPIQARIAELLTLWAISRLSQKQPMDSVFIAFTLGIALEQAIDHLTELASAKIVRYNKIREQWELHDGSSVDVDSIITEKLSTANLMKEDASQILGKHLPAPYILPNEYNDTMYMLRYAAFRFVWFSELQAGVSVDTAADDYILFVLLDHEEQMEHASTMLGTGDRQEICAVPAFSVEAILQSLREYAVIDDLLQDIHFLAQDARLKNELQYLLQQTSARIGAFVERYLAYGELTWWSNRERIDITNSTDLENEISERMNAKYPHTPQVRNEAFNRNKISSIQKRAVIDVIDRLIRIPEELNLGITGYGPNYLIYASVLKNNGYYYDSEQGMQVGTSMQALHRQIQDAIVLNPIGRLVDLVRIFKERPYGIRSAVIPVLFVALLRDHWEQLLFYADDMLTTHLSGESVYELIERAEAYEYRYFELSMQEKEQLIRLGQHFQLPIEVCSNFIYVAEVMLSWLRGLPKFTQMTNQLSETTLHIRECIRGAETDPYRNMKLIASMEPFLAEAIEELQTFMHGNEIELEKQVLDFTKQQTKTEFIAVLEKPRGSVIGMNSKLQTVPPDIKEDGRMVDTLIRHMVGVERKDWSDATQELFLRQMKYEWQMLESVGEAAVSAETAYEASYVLSKKSQVLYSNVKNLLKYAGKDVPSQEVKQLLLKLLQEV